MSKKCSNSELLVRIDERVGVIQKDLSEIKNNYETHVKQDEMAFRTIYEKLIVLQNHNERIRTLERRGVGYRLGYWFSSFVSGILGIRK